MKEKSEYDLNEIRRMPAGEAISLLDIYLKENPENEDAYVIRGLKYWSIGKRKDAINDYLAAIKLNPESKAKMALDYANSILDYYNKDLLNP